MPTKAPATGDKIIFPEVVVARVKSDESIVIAETLSNWDSMSIVTSTPSPEGLVICISFPCENDFT